ncbi:hypothetical protein BDY24DRAFT_412475 [Mrakia frigida]|uniref:uncharacterized protein n=1 Tax=Mrakia frigida TaxID=29902 RepID=UPI003FCC1B64
MPTSSTPLSWSLKSTNLMDGELLEALSFDVYISNSEFLHRATGFWTSHLLQQQQRSKARRACLPDLFPVSLLASPPPPPSTGNLFLTQRRSGVEENRYKEGIVSSPRSGRRMSGESEEMQTVWKEGRLERTEAWSRSGNRSSFVDYSIVFTTHTHS